LIIDNPIGSKSTHHPTNNPRKWGSCLNEAVS
jgi:hypothetical protein